MNPGENIYHYKTEGKGAFQYKPDEKVLAEMVYTMPNPRLMVIDHTDVDDSLRGLGIGKILQQHLVEYVRLNGIKVIPICPFAKKMFERTKEWSDVLYAR